MNEPRKSISARRDRLQSRILVAVVGGILAFYSALLFLFTIVLQKHARSDALSLKALGVSLTFGLLVWALRSATFPAALCGAAICWLVTVGSGNPGRLMWRSGLTPLAALFALTFVATRLGRKRKEEGGLAEDRGGRRASQVVANLGASALIVPLCFSDFLDFLHPGGLISFSSLALPALLLATLAEATADTVSSEIGQAFGGTPYLITTLRRTSPGTDGAITLIGTSAGILAAALVVTAGVCAMGLTTHEGVVALAAGIAGLFFDSLLGATLERRGWLGNDLVNFSSTVFAAAIALLWLLGRGG